MDGFALQHRGDFLALRAVGVGFLGDDQVVVDEFLELSVSYLSDRGLNGEAGRQQGYRSAYAEDRHEHACFVSEDVTGGHFVCEIQTVP